MTSTKRLMRSLLSGSMALMLATLATEARAQSGAENADGSDAQEAMPLSAAIADFRRSPFYALESLVPLGSSMAMHPWTPLAVGSPGSSIQSAPNDSTFPTTRVFWAAWGSSVLTAGVGVVLVVGSAYDRTSVHVPLAVAGFAVPVVGVAGGATLAGARFGPALIGSSLGVATFFGIHALTSEGDIGWGSYLLGTVVHAAVTTVIASRSN